MDESINVPMMVRSLGAGGYVRTNRPFAERVGIDPEELAQRPLADWVVDEDRELLIEALASGAEECFVMHRTADGGCIGLELRLRDRGEEGIVMARAVDRCQQSLPDDSDATVKGTLHRIAQIVQEQNPGLKCSILLVAHDRFVSGAGPSLPDEYNEAIDGYAVGPTVGSCGTAIYWNVPVIVEDIQADPLWAPFAPLAKKAGVAACWSHPFTSKGGRVLGALALYSPVACAPTEAQLSSLKAAAQMTGLAVERGRAEEELRSANAVKARFMANLSHEIRTPLNALVGVSDVLAESPEVPDSEVRMLREAGDQLLELFNGALELTEVRDRRGKEQIVELRDVLRDAFEPAARTADDKKLATCLELTESVPGHAAVDRWSLERIVKLLAQNAVKFTDRGKVALTVDYDGQDLQLEFVDSGCGIDLDRIEQLRKPFVQGDLSTTKRHGGFGLGLALCDQCVEALGGQIAFSSHPGGGTQVQVRIPVRPVEAPAASEGPVSIPFRPTANAPVLVVEDNLMNQRVIGKILERAGFDCEFSGNGAEALEAMATRRFSSVLMDCQMPVMDGYEATRRIRAHEEASGSHIPIIAVTANALAEDRERCLEAGMDEYLKKPVRQSELAAVLEHYLGAPSRSTEALKTRAA